ncbi:MAG TPA: alpha/beta hydrolase [Streptosporangiaceae bacterium]|nr:alpha/beta hydrolase [Streptosporangiaceae bacterium]
MTIAETPAQLGRPRRFRRIARRVTKAAGIAVAALLVAGTAASFGYNLATDGPAPRPAHLLFAKGGGWDTRYLEWGTRGPPVVLVPGAAETADTFARLGPVLAENHRVFAIDLSGTGYSAPNPPFSADHLADQIRAFLAAQKLIGPDAPILVGHSAGAADAGIAALYRPGVVKGVVFLDGDATPLGIPSFPGAIASTLLVNPYKTSALRLALSQDWLIKDIYASNCGRACPPLDEAGVDTWRWPLEQPGFQAEVSYTLRHGITAMTAAQFAELKAAGLPKLVVAGASDPQIPHSDAALTARRIGAPTPVYVPGRHLTMISSPRQVAAAIDSLRPGPPG